MERKRVGQVYSRPTSTFSPENSINLGKRRSRITFLYSPVSKFYPFCKNSIGNHQFCPKIGASWEANFEEFPEFFLFAINNYQ